MISRSLAFISLYVVDGITFRMLLAFWWKPRVVLLFYVIGSLHGTWLMEQPKGSDHIISRHPRFEQLVNEKVFAPGLYVATSGFALVSEIFSPLPGEQAALLDDVVWSSVPETNGMLGQGEGATCAIRPGLSCLL